MRVTPFNIDRYLYWILSLLSFGAAFIIRVIITEAIIQSRKEGV